MVNYSFNYKIFVEVLKINLVVFEQTKEGMVEITKGDLNSEDINEICSNYKIINPLASSNEISDNKFEKFLDPKLKLKNSSQLKMKYFTYDQLSTILSIMERMLSSLAKDFRVNLNSLVEMCTEFLITDSISFEISEKVYSHYITNKILILKLLNTALTKSIPIRYSLYPFMQKIQNQINFKTKDQKYLLAMLDFLYLNLDKFPIKFYYDIIFVNCNMLQNLSTIVYNRKDIDKNEEIKINTKKVFLFFNQKFRLSNATCSMGIL